MKNILNAVIIVLQLKNSYKCDHHVIFLCFIGGPGGMMRGGQHGTRGGRGGFSRGGDGGRGGGGMRQSGNPNNLSYQNRR